MDPTIEIAQAPDIDTVLALVEALLAELGEEGQEFAQIDRLRLRDGLQREMASAEARFLALLARDDSGTAIGVLTLSTSFAVYAGGEYGVIDEMYVRPEWRSRGVGRALVDAAVGLARQRGWFRLDVTGPNAAGSPVAASAVAGVNAGAPAVGSPGAVGDPALRFYLGLGFEPTGQKLRLLVPR
jgi:GNAT superfamily N-acetyltransferase